MEEGVRDGQFRTDSIRLQVGADGSDAHGGWPIRLRDRGQDAMASDGDSELAEGWQLAGVVATGGVSGYATHYCASYTDCPYEGQPLGCGAIQRDMPSLRDESGGSRQEGVDRVLARDGLYHNSNPTIAASAWRPDGSRAYECGAQLVVCGLGGLYLLDERSAPTSQMGEGEAALASGAASLREVPNARGCAVVIVQDACPGCFWDRETGSSTIDLSEAAFELVCGELGLGACEVRIERMR